MGDLDTRWGEAEFFRQMLDELNDAVYAVDRGRRIVYWNRAAERISGYSREAAVGSHCFDGLLCHTDGRGRELCRARCPLEATIRDGQPRGTEIFLKHREGHRVAVDVRVSPLRAADGAIIGGIEVFRENGEKLEAVQRADRNEALALLDPLTQAGNRRYAEQAAAALLERGTCGAVLFDLDHFKALNDRHGHEAGDAVLRMVARTLRQGVRGLDLVARWGGEEFLAVIASGNEAALSGAARRCLAMIRASRLEWQGQELRVTASAGAALSQPGDHIEDLVRRADRALYRAKAGGRNRSVVAPAA